MTIRVRLTYGVGGCSTERVMEFPDGTSAQEIGYATSDKAREEFWYSHEIMGDDDE